MPSSNDKLPPVSFDASFMAMIRGVLAAAALLVLALDPVAHLSFRLGYQLRRAERRNPNSAVRAEILPVELTRLLFAWPDREAVVFSERHWVWQRCHPMASAEVIDLRRGARRAADEQLAAPPDLDLRQAQRRGSA
jgi:hypothetical protein